MAEPAVPMPRRRRIELPMLEARNRFMQLLRLASLTGQVTVVTDQGRPAAAIVPASAVLSDEPSTAPKTHTENAAAGWMRRIEQVREAVRRQHATRISELEHALTAAWDVIDRVAPRGTDRAADELRVAQRDVLSMPPPTEGSPARPS
ncbi:type II toxin-antitoxin system prevent-host-death family antitoxin [Actinoplanes sp. NPDC049316]|uniref:type II toxin-antitoxin system prevent-host-death family antitoxin n=1 Tax=Actinoplanes sp. NPDC049316 TaxID=3154727 RepID=UPI0034338444